MTGRNTSVFGLLAILLVAVAGLTGCGYKTMPVPPAEIVPRAVTDLRYELNEKGVLLSWTYPGETVRGERLDDIVAFKLFRAVVPADQYCETCPIPFSEPVTVEGGAVVPDKQKTGRYQASLLRPGHLYFFKVRSASGWWAESADSNTVSFLWDIPPASPESLAAAVADRKVTLRWSQVTTRIDGTDIKESVNYRVLRSTGSGPFAQVGDLQSGLEFVDRQVDNGRQYQYKVQAVTMYEKGQVGGGVSPMVTALPVDQTAPPAPAGVQGVRTATGVKVVWEKVEGVDLQGYRVYRRLPGVDKPVRVGEVRAPFTMYDDPAPPEADMWYYSVSSIDGASPANESSPSPEVEVRN